MVFLLQIGVIGLGSGRTSVRASSKYKVNSTVLKLSSCGVPRLLVSGFDVEVPFTRVVITVLLRRNCISVCSSASTIVFTIIIEEMASVDRVKGR